MNPRQILLSLLIVTFLAGVTILCLLLLHKSAIVELELVVDEAHFTILPYSLLNNLVEVLDPQIQLTKLELRRFDTFNATLREPTSGRVSLRVAEDGRIRIRSSSSEASVGSPFYPTLKFFSPISIEIIPESRNNITIRLVPNRRSVKAWECRVIPREDLEVVFKNVAGLTGIDKAGLAPYAPPVYVSGGSRDSQISLSFISEAEDSTIVTVLDLERGTATEKIFPVRVPGEESLVALGGQLVAIARRSPDIKGSRFLMSNLKIRDLAFFRLHGFEEQSFLLGGKINFPGKEKESIELEEGSILVIPKNTEFKLKSILSIDSGLRIVLWGKPSSVKVGPTIDLMEEVLPSVFAWLSTHSLGAFVFTTLGAIVGATIGLLRLLGLVRQ